MISARVTQPSRSGWRRAAALALGVVLATLSVRAGGDGEGGQAGDPSVVTADGVINGRVLASATLMPLRSAEVRLRHANGRDTRLTTTDDQGEFEQQDLPAGEWTVTASKAGFVPQQVGQTGPRDAPTPVKLANGQRLTVEVRLTRASAIAGRITNEFGDPLGGFEVRAVRSRTIRGVRQLVLAGTPDLTDDLGAFRLYGLMPGDYFVSANSPFTASDFGGEPSATMYFPGTTRLGDAQLVRLKPGEDQLAVDLTAPARSQGVTISGVVTSSAGAPLSGAEVRLIEEQQVERPGLARTFGAADSNGRFTLRRVMPGSYLLEAATYRGGQSPESALIPLDVGTTDVTDVTVTMTTRNPVSVAVAIGAESGPLPQGLDIGFRAQSSGAGSDRSMVSFRSANNRFPVVQLSGRLTFEVSVATPGWMVKRIELDGRDVTDGIIDLSNAGPNVTARIILTARVGELSGTVALGNASRAHVVVFADDPARWQYPSRHVKTVRTDAQGQFTISGLPEERYRVIAVSYLEEEEFQDPAFLEQVRKLGTEVRLGEGEKRTVSLQMMRR